MLEREWCVCPTHNYLVIQKCGNSYLRDIFQKIYGESYFLARECNFRNLKWTVVRDPKDRFISGLAYDLWKNNYSNFDKVFENLNKLVQYPISSTFYNQGKVKHTILQSAYLVFQPIDVFVNLPDLTEFVLHNFGITGEEYNKVPGEFKVQVKEEIVKRGIEQRVDDLLANDVYLYNQICNSDRLWCWQNGNVVGYSK
jgi:hypothetical protein